MIEEVKGLYKRALKERIDDYSKSLEKLNTTLFSTQLPKLAFLDFDIETEKYLEFLNNKLRINSDNIIAFKNDYLPELVKRTIERRKPLDGKGQQFRDGLLWLTILDYARKQGK